MPFPTITPEEVQQAIPEVADVAFLERGGQKVVFTCTIDGEQFVLKFLKPQVRPLWRQEATDATADQVPFDDVTARAQREVALMKECDTPYLVKIGPIEMRAVQIGGEDLLYFSEERIVGEALSKSLQNSGPLAPNELIQLGQHVASAIDVLWRKNKIHRDIKPGNIMRRESGGFVVLDLGLVFDLDDESYSLGPVGTRIYFSPEQMDFANRRQVLDFRSDLFSLGITMYEMATRQHPFVENAKTSWDVMNNIRNHQPPAPHQLRAEIPESLSDIIMRLLGKRASLRFRKINMLQQALADAAVEGED